MNGLTNYDAWLCREPDDEPETESVHDRIERARAALEEHCDRVFEESREEQPEPERCPCGSCSPTYGDR